MTNLKMVDLSTKVRLYDNVEAKDKDLTILEFLNANPHMTLTEVLKLLHGLSRQGMVCVEAGMSDAYSLEVIA